MSVINKMLNDLEKRNEEQGLEGYDGKYTPSESNGKSKVVIISLVALVVALLALLSWLLIFDKSSERNSPVVSNPAVNETAAADKQTQIDEAVKAANDKLAAELAQEVADKPVKVNPLKKAVKQPKKPTVQPKPSIEELNETDPIKVAQQLIAAEQEKTQQLNAKKQAKQPDPKPVVKQEQVAPTFKIEKTTAKLTPEQKVARLMTDAKEAFEKGLISDALENLTKVLKVSDDHIDARDLMAVAWYGRGEVERAIAILNDGLNRYPNVYKWRVTAAKMFYKENDKSGALSYLAAELSNANEEYYAMKANVARELKNWPLAESAYTMLTRKQPENGSWWLGQAIAIDSQQKYERAILSYQTALSKGQLSSSSRTFVENRLQELQQ